LIGKCADSDRSNSKLCSTGERYSEFATQFKPAGLLVHKIGDNSAGNGGKMGKRNKKGKQSDDASGENKIVSTKEPAYHRVNFLAQAAALLLLQGESTGSHIVAQHYARTMTLIRQKMQVKLHPSLKRTTCSRCYSMLVFGSSIRLKVRKHGKSYLCVTCKTCGTVKRFQCGREHLLAIEKAELCSTKEDN
ncbi:ribonuclease P protein component 4 domain protein, partial [Trichuris suis]